MTIDELMQTIDEDLTLNANNLQDKLYKIPNYHSKYLRMFFDYKSKLLTAQQKLQLCYKNKYHYYAGIEKDCYEFTLDKKEIEFHILSDEEYSDLNLKVEKYKLLVDCLDRTLKRVGYMANDVKSIINYLTYMQGC